MRELIITSAISTIFVALLAIASFVGTYFETRRTPVYGHDKYHHTEAHRGVL